MKLEDYFNFLTPSDIRIKDSRIGIETVLYEYIYDVKTPEEIAQIYPTLTLEQIYATILYYLHEPEKIKQYMAIWLEHCLRSARQQDENPSDYILKLRQLKAEKQAEKRTTYEHTIPV